MTTMVDIARVRAELDDVETDLAKLRRQLSRDGFPIDTPEAQEQRREYRAQLLLEISELEREKGQLETALALIGEDA